MLFRSLVERWKANDDSLVGHSDDRTRNVARSLKLHLDSLPNRAESRRLLAILVACSRFSLNPQAVPDVPTFLTSFPTTSGPSCNPSSTNS